MIVNDSVENEPAPKGCPTAPAPCLPYFELAAAAAAAAAAEATSFSISKRFTSRVNMSLSCVTNCEVIDRSLISINNHNKNNIHRTVIHLHRLINFF